jgi:hypothetical protein
VNTHPTTQLNESRGERSTFATVSGWAGGARRRGRTVGLALVVAATLAGAVTFAASRSPFDGESRPAAHPEKAVLAGPTSSVPASVASEPPLARTARERPDIFLFAQSSEAFIAELAREEAALAAAQFLATYQQRPDLFLDVQHSEEFWRALIDSGLAR